MKTKFDKIQDSGEKQKFETGAVRDLQEGKGRFDLIPPIVLERLAKHYELGSLKYNESNFRLGIPIKRYIDSALRHINKYRMGLEDEDHLIAAIWNLAGIIETEYLIELGYLTDYLDNGKFYSKKVFDQIKKYQEEYLKNKKIKEQIK